MKIHNFFHFLLFTCEGALCVTFQGIRNMTKSKDSGYGYQGKPKHEPTEVGRHLEISKAV
jgi:hypothetical protein